MAKAQTPKHIDGYISQFPADVRAILRRVSDGMFNPMAAKEP